MSLELETKQVTLDHIERTFRFVGNVPRNGSPSVDVYREKLWLDSDGNQFGNASVTTIGVSWDAIKDKSWVLSDGTTITAIQVFTALAMAFDEIAG